MAREQLKNLTEPMYYILLSLMQDNHGYGIMQMVEELTDGRVAIGAGTLYSLLGRFEREEIIYQVAEENRRKIYHITERGEDLLKEEYERLNHLVEDGRKFFQYDGQRKEPPEGGRWQRDRRTDCGKGDGAGGRSCRQRRSRQKREEGKKGEERHPDAGQLALRRCLLRMD